MSTEGALKIAVLLLILITLTAGINSAITELREIKEHLFYINLKLSK